MQIVLPDIVAPAIPTSLADLFLSALPIGPPPVTMTEQERGSLRLYQPPPWQPHRPDFHKLPVPQHNCKHRYCNHFGIHPEVLSCTVALLLHCCNQLCIRTC